MKKLISLLILIVSIGANAATVTGTLRDIGIAALQTQITFTPTNVVQVTDNGLLVGDTKTILATNGAFSIVLETGRHKVSFPKFPQKIPFFINVPNTNATFDIRDLATNIVVYNFTNIYSAMRLDTNGSLVAPTNFFAANSNALNAAVAAQAIDTNAFVSTNDSRLTDSRSPSGAAGGDLTGTFPNPTLSAAAKNDLTNGIVTAVAANTANISSVSNLASQAVAKDNGLGTNLISVNSFTLQNIDDPIAGVFFTNDDSGLKIFSSDDRNPENLWGGFNGSGVFGNGTQLTGLVKSANGSATNVTLHYPTHEVLLDGDGIFSDTNGVQSMSINGRSLAGAWRFNADDTATIGVGWSGFQFGFFNNDGTRNAYIDTVNQQADFSGYNIIADSFSGGGANITGIDLANIPKQILTNANFESRILANSTNFVAKSGDTMSGKLILKQLETFNYGVSGTNGMQWDGSRFLNFWRGAVNNVGSFIDAQNSVVFATTIRASGKVSFDVSDATTLVRDADNVLALKNSSASNTFRVYKDSTTYAQITSGRLELPEFTNSWTPMSSSAGIFATNISGTTELMSYDSGGNHTINSPHGMNGPASLYDDTDEMPMVTFEYNDFTGKARWINHSREARRVEQLENAVQVLISLVNTNGLTGIQIAKLAIVAQLTQAQKDIVSVSNNFVAPKTWASVQDAHQSEYDALRADELAQYNTPVTNIVDGATNISAANTNIVVRPDVDIRKPIPAWLQSRGVTE